jgi:hypothetical protein
MTGSGLTRCEAGTDKNFSLLLKNRVDAYFLICIKAIQAFAAVRVRTYRAALNRNALR